MPTARPAATVLSLLLVLSGCSDDPEASARAAAAPSPSATSRPSPSAADAGPAPSREPSAGAAVAPVEQEVPSADVSPAPSAAGAASPATSASPAAPPASPVPARPARLTGDGLELPQGAVPFGTSVQAALPVLTAAFGRPTGDSGETASFGVYGTCPGTRLRALEFGGGALVLLFGDVDGPALTLYAWRLTPSGSAAGLPRAVARGGQATGVEVGIGTSVTALRDAAGAAVEISAGDEIVGPSFRLRDASAGLYGSLSAATGGGTVTSVQAGQPCGE